MNTLRPSGRIFVRSTIAAIFIATGSIAAAEKIEKPVTICIAGGDFQFHGDWSVTSDRGITTLTAPNGAKLPAATAVMIPRAGKYRLWVCTRDFPNDRPGIRTFAASVGGRKSDATFGKSGIEGYSWEDGGTFDLKAGQTLLCFEDAKPFARAQGALLTTDEKFKPAKYAGPGGIRATPPVAINVPAAAGEKAGDVKIENVRPIATLSNPQLELDFLPARRGELNTVVVKPRVKGGEKWHEIPQDPSAEGYFAVCAPADAKMSFHGFYPSWNRVGVAPVTVEAGGVSVKTIGGRVTAAVFDAGIRHRFVPSKAQMQGSAVKMEFHPSPAGQLEATWSLPPDQSAAQVTLSFTPATDGQVTLGYELFIRRELAQVAELLSPMMFQRHRLPERDLTLLDNVAPVPIALVQPVGTPATALGVLADPAGIPFGWPDGRKPNYGLSIRDRGGWVQPSIWGPVIGAPDAAAKANQKVEMRFRIVLRAGDWYAGLRTAVDDVFGVGDYRSNAGTSLSDAAMNMIELIGDDQHGGWWERAKSFYQIETKNGGTQPSPMLLMSLYRLTGDAGLYRNRVLPTLQFMLSRDGPHFSPFPDDTGPYPAGSMNGPVKLYGTTTYGGLWEFTGRRTPALGAIALPAGGVRATAGYSHAQQFDEWLARYLLTGDKKDLAKACELADKYVDDMEKNPPKKDLGSMPFFFISFTPDWEGLLWMYEVTENPRYLNAAVFGARQLMSGLWCHPQFPRQDVKIHAGGTYDDQHPHQWWRGSDRFRLGWPRKPGDAPEKNVPGWLVSNVGLGFEQPSTVRASGTGRLIYQMYWAPHFLRLYRYTGDKAFLTCARNAVVGRFANYPGYYITGHTDLPLKPDYPSTGPDVTDIYYHHIAPHLAWTIDYLVSEAEMLSDKKIWFPALRQYGYAYFDSRIYGHAPGKVYEDSDAWLIFRKGLVTLDNPQINCLTAHTATRLHVILTNQSRQAQEVKVEISRKLTGLKSGQTLAKLRIGNEMPSDLWLAEGRGKLTIPARGLVVLSIAGAKPDAPQRPQPSENVGEGEAIRVLKDGPVETRAAAIQVDPGQWEAYFWATATPAQVKSVTLRYEIGKGWQSLQDNEYPFEFLIPVADEKTRVQYRFDIIHAGGARSSTAEGLLKLGR